MLKRNFILAAGTAALLVACDKDKQPSNGEENQNAVSRYIIAATPPQKNDQAVADYLLTTDDLTQGSVSTLGNGIEQDGTWRYYVTSQNKFFSFNYAQRADGSVAIYDLTTTGNLNKLTNFDAYTMASFGAVGNDILGFKISRNVTDPIANWLRIGVAENHIVARGTIDQKALANKPNGELAYFVMPTQVGNKVFLPYFTIFADRSKGSFSTEYPDEANVAIYSYPSMTHERTITTDKVSFLGRYFTDGLAVDEKGDVYGYSASVAQAGVKGDMSSTKPSAIVRIKKDGTAFDDAYYFNVEEATNNEYYLTEWKYAKDGKVLGYFNKKEKKGAYARGNRMGIIDLYTKKITWVTGMPAEDDIKSLTRDTQTYVWEDKNTISIGVVTEAEGSYVYNINVNTATATKGLKVEGGTITGISKISVKQ